MAISNFKKTSDPTNFFIFITAETLILGLTYISIKGQTYTYKQTGNNPLTEFHLAHSQFHLDVILHILMSSLVFAIFVKTINLLMATLGLFLFHFTSQHSLVFLSSPFWDYINFLPILISVLIIIEICKKKSILFRIQKARYGIGIFLTNFLLTLLILSNEFRKNYGSFFGKHLVLDAFVWSSPILLIVIFINLKRLKYKFLEYTKKSEFLILQLFLFNLVTCTLYTRWTTSLIGILLNISMFLIGFTKLISNKAKFIIFSIFTLLNLILLFGLSFFRASGVGFAFYFLAGISNPANPTRLFNYNEFDALIPFWDGSILNFLNKIEMNTVELIINFSAIFQSTLTSHFFEFFRYSIWSFGLGDPPASSNETFSQFWTAWSEYGVFQFLSVVCFMSTMYILLKKSRIKFLLVAFSFIAVSVLAIFTRVQLHQWWFIDTLGIWFFLHFLSKLTLIKVYHKKYTPNLHNFRLAFDHVFFIKLISISLISVVTCILAPKILGSYRNDLTVSYLNKDWRTLPKTQLHYEVNSSSLIEIYSFEMDFPIRMRISTKGNCIDYEYSIYSRLATSGQFALVSSGMGRSRDNFFIPLDAREFYVQLSSGDNLSCNWNLEYVKESQFKSIPVAYFQGDSHNPVYPSKSLVSNMDLIQIPSGFGKLSANFSGRVSGSQYKAYGEEGLVSHLLENTSARVLGYSGEGYQLRDLSSISYQAPKFSRSLVVSGTLQKGSLGVLVNSLVDQYLPASSKLSFKYAEPLNSKNFDFCFNQEEYARYNLTLFQFQDQYGFGWSRYRNLNFKILKNDCEYYGFVKAYGIRANFQGN